MPNPVVLQGVPVTEPDAFRRLASRPTPWRPRAVAAARHVIGLSASILAHLLLALLLLHSLGRLLPEDPGAGVIEIALSVPLRPPLPLVEPQPVEKPPIEPEKVPEPPAPPAEEPPEPAATPIVPETPQPPATTTAPAPPPPPAPVATTQTGSLYGNRRDGRSDAVAAYGGSTESELCVERALDWLARHQQRDGSWSLSDDAPDCPKDARCRTRLPANGREAWDRQAVSGGADGATGLTSLVLLAFLGAGSTHTGGPHQKTVERGLRYVLQHQGKDDSFFLARCGMMYEHGLATLMLSEACALSGDPGLLDPLTRAIGFIVRTQDRSGGWNYSRGQQNFELTLSVWQIFALVSALKQRIHVPDDTLHRARSLLARATLPDGRVLYDRTGTGDTRGKLTLGALGAATFARMVLGGSLPQASVDLLRRTSHLPAADSQDGPIYFWYYKSLALFQLQDDSWNTWNLRIRDLLVDRQVREGHASGCWLLRDVLDPDRGFWRWSIESRVYVTAMSALILEVYYRYLPFYRTPGALLQDSRVDAPITAPVVPLPPSIDTLRAQLASTSSYDRWQAARQVAERKLGELLPDILKAVALEKSDLAGSMLECIGALGDRSAAAGLIPYLNDTRPRARDGARNALRTLLGRDLGADPGPWRDWVKANVR